MFDDFDDSYVFIFYKGYFVYFVYKELFFVSVIVYGIVIIVFIDLGVSVNFLDE